METKETNFNYLLYAITFVAILIAATAAITYAYFKFNVQHDTTLVNINASLECLNLGLSDSGTSISLSYNYPITDTLATTSNDGSVKPLTVTVTNNCDEALNYTLTLSSLEEIANPTNYIEDSKIRYQMFKNDTLYKGIDYLNNIALVSNTNSAYKDLAGTSGELATKYPNYNYKNIYALDDTISINGGASNKYDLYLWVDYYEGDAKMYTDANAEHDTTFDGTTEGKKFAAAISLSINS